VTSWKALDRDVKEKEQTKVQRRFAIGQRLTWGGALRQKKQDLPRRRKTRRGSFFFALKERGEVK